MATTYTNMGLMSWNAGADLFSYADLDANWAKIANHDHTSGNGVQVPTDGIADNAITSAKILNDTIVNADINSAAAIVGTKLAANTITNDRIATADLDKLGLTSGSTIRRAHLAIDQDESTASTTVGGVYLTTNDKVTVTVPNNSLLIISYTAWVKNSVTLNARARLTINGNQLQTLSAGVWGSGAVDYVGNASTANYSPLSTTTGNPGVGIIDIGGTTGTNATPPAYPTGGYFLGLNSQLSSNLVYARIETGFTGDIGIKYWNNAAGTTNVHRRRLTVWTVGF
jgi:hypothetical protein